VLKLIFLLLIVQPFVGFFSEEIESPWTYLKIYVAMQLTIF